MPMLIINMGGEMVYILEQRLTAQAVATDKAKRGAGGAPWHAPKIRMSLLRPRASGLCLRDSTV